jgi:hypothetical protein
VVMQATNNCGSDVFTTQLIVTSIDNLSKSIHFSMDPNPVKDFLTIHFNEMPKAVVKILDMTGKQVMENITVSETQHINVQLLPSGVYYLQVVGETGSSVQKFIKL